MESQDKTHHLIALLIALYPRPWRTRYADEFAMVLEESPLTLPVVLDVCKGAAEAHLHYGREAGKRQSERRKRERRAAFIAILLLYGCPVSRRHPMITSPRPLLP